MRSRSTGQRTASAGISTDGCTTPHAIGIVALRLSRNVSRRVIPSSDASSTASGSHGASTTRAVRLDIHCTASRPRSRRHTTKAAPAVQSASSHIMTGTGDAVDGMPVTMALAPFARPATKQAPTRQFSETRCRSR